MASLIQEHSQGECPWRISSKDKSVVAGIALHGVSLHDEERSGILLSGKQSLVERPVGLGRVSRFSHAK
jgi:hypothetical protein